MRELAERLRAEITPSTLPAVAMIGVFVYWAGTEAGYPLRDWMPGALFALALLAVTLTVGRLRLRELPMALRVVAIALAAFTAWTFLSITWADSKGDAWDGANRTLLYLVVFLLFALWRQHGLSAGLLLVIWVIATIALGTFTLFDLRDDPAGGFYDGVRLVEPAGYVNAAAATWLMAAFPALALASRIELPWWLRGPLAGGIVVLCALSLLSQSRGALFAAPVALVVYFLLVPSRVRSLVLLIPVGVGLALTLPEVKGVADRLAAEDAQIVLGDVVERVIIVAVIVGAFVGAAAAIETLRPLSERVARTGNRVVGATGIAAAMIGVVVAIALFGNPVTLVSDGWASFKQGYNDQLSGSSRLSGGLGSNRYDFYRVAIDSFADDPLVGVGMDNFRADYLERGLSDETPRYPHSLEVMVLSETGLIGALLLLAAIGAAFTSVAIATLRARRFAATVAGGAAMVFVYFAAHATGDWFWEFAGLGAPAFAFLGLACALQPRRTPDPADAPPSPIGTLKRRRARPITWAIRAALAVVFVIAALSIVGPWLALLNVEEAGRSWQSDPDAAFRRIDQAADHNPLSDTPYEAGGTIAVRRDDLPAAETLFRDALERDPRNAYAALQLGGILSLQNHRAEAIPLLERAVELSPRDPLARLALRQARTGRVDLDAINKRILEQVRELAGG